MELIDQISINQYAQGVVSIEQILDCYDTFSLKKKKDYLEILIGYFILQSKPLDSDIPLAIKESGLKPTYTPCVMLKKGVSPHILRNIIALPENESKKVLILLLSLFKIAYLRRFHNEKNDPNKWWYWDLSDEKNIEIILHSLH